MCFILCNSQVAVLKLASLALSAAGVASASLPEDEEVAYPSVHTQRGKLDLKGDGREMEVANVEVPGPLVHSQRNAFEVADQTGNVSKELSIELQDAYREQDIEHVMRLLGLCLRVHVI